MTIVQRDITKDFNYYTAAIDLRQNKLNGFLTNIKHGEHDNTPFLCEYIQSLYFEISDLMYSRGDDITGIVKWVEKGLDFQSVKMYYYRKSGKSVQNVLLKSTDNSLQFEKAYANTAAFEHFFSILQILSRSILLDINTDLLSKYVNDLTRPGIDFLLDSIINYSINTWPVKGKRNYTKKVELLNNTFFNNEAQRIEYLKLYTTGWLKRMSANPRFGQHMLKDFNYVGYWCYEAAAIAKITSTPVAELNILKYYPADYLLSTT